MSDDGPFVRVPTVCICGHCPLEEFRADPRDIPPTPHSLGCSECGFYETIEEDDEDDHWRCNTADLARRSTDEPPDWPYSTGPDRER